MKFGGPLKGGRGSPRTPLPLDPPLNILPLAFRGLLFINFETLWVQFLPEVLSTSNLIRAVKLISYVVFTLFRDIHAIHCTERFVEEFGSVLKIN